MGKRHYLSDEILKGLWADDYLQARYHLTNSANRIYLLIPFYEYQGTHHTAHAPQSCLLGGGWSIVETSKKPVAFSSGNGHALEMMHLKKGDVKILATYFFYQRGRVIPNPWLNKFFLIWDSIAKQRTDGALVRAEMVLGPNQDCEDAYSILEDFIVDLYLHLREYVPL